MDFYEGYHRVFPSGRAASCILLGGFLHHLYRKYLGIYQKFMCMVFSEKSMPENTEDTKSVENIIYLLSLSLGNSYFILKEDALAYF